MNQLIFVSFLWAFSFGLIKTQLSSIDSNTVASLRLLISFLVFLPFLKLRILKEIELKNNFFLMLVGAIQFGLMYVCYIKSYQYLKAYEVALFTIFTPFYISFFNDILQRSFTPKNFVAAFFAILGGLVVAYKGEDMDIKWQGIVLLQGANISFAIGQLLYAKVDFIPKTAKDSSFFSLLYLGGFISATCFAIGGGGYENLQLNTKQILSLIYLGAVPSGLGFFLWNYGARRVSTATLSAINNLTIPIGVIVSIVFYGEAVDFNTALRIFISCILISIGLYLGNRNSISA